MVSSEDFKKVYERYQKEGVLNGMSIVDFCQHNGIVYSQFERWFKNLHNICTMERQDYIDTINDLRNTIESLRMTMGTLQATIDTLNRNARRQEAEAVKNNELIDTLKRQIEYQESLNSRHNKHRFNGTTLSQKNRNANKKKGRDKEKEDYTGPSDNRTDKGKNDSRA